MERTSGLPGVGSDSGTEAKEQWDGDSMLNLQLPVDPRYVGVLSCAVDTMARVRHFESSERERLSSGVDRLFAYLCQVAVETSPISLRIVGRPYLVRAEFRFRAKPSSVKSLNFNASVMVRHEDGTTSELNLLSATRLSDRSRLDFDGLHDFTLLFEVDKRYEKVELNQDELAYRAPYRILENRDPDILRHAIVMAISRYSPWHCPASFFTPGKYLDMDEANHFISLVAVDADRRPAGLICWTPTGSKGLSFSGPFVFTPKNDAKAVASLLLDGFLERIVHQGREILFSERATPDVVPGYFDSLGELLRFDTQNVLSQPVLFRHLREDSGATVWVHPSLHEFARQKYDALDMSRDMLKAEALTRRPHGDSLFSTLIDRAKGLAVLRALMDGEDFQENLDSHVKSLWAKGIRNILFYMDLSHAWEAALAEILARDGFVPKLILPHAGRSDVLVYEYVPSDRSC